MQQSLIDKLKKAKAELEQQIESVLDQKGSVQPHLAYWKALDDAIKAATPSP